MLVIKAKCILVLTLLVEEVEPMPKISINNVLPILISLLGEGKKGICRAICLGNACFIRIKPLTLRPV